MSGKKETSKTVGSAVVVGGGIGGMQTALDLAESGIKVYLVDKSSVIGGRMVALDKTFPTNECAMCVVSPKLVECGRHRNIEIITNTDIEAISGQAGNFEVSLLKRARFVDIDKCTGCDECVSVCPVRIPNDFDSGIGERKAIYRMYPQAVPAAFTIDKCREQSPCRVACPAGVNAHGYVALIREGKFSEALELIRKRDPFPSICGRVCYHPCEGKCLRQEIDEPIAIRALKRFLSDYQKTEKTTGSKKNLNRNERIAIVGAGPAGLTCAYDLIGLGYKVVVYEKLAKAGGMLLTGIPEYRLPKDILDIEIQNLIDQGIEIKTNVSVGKELTISRLMKEYQAVFIAVGAHLSRKLNIPGENIPGVVPGVDFLREFNLSRKAPTGRRVIIIGGGNVAIDSARSALRLGAKEVTILYRRSRTEMPANSGEIKEAEEEGARFHFLAAPVKILGRDNKVIAIECIKMQLAEPDASGRRRPLPVKGSEFKLEADLVIPAIGQSPDLAGLEENLSKTSWGTIEVDPLTLETSASGVFAGGDAVSGPATVVDALAAGHEAAISIERHIQHKDLKQGRKLEPKAVSTLPQRRFEKQERVKIPLLSLKERRDNFREVEFNLSEDEAVREAARCLDCGICCECFECEKVCEPEAISHDMKDEYVKINTGAIVLSPGVGLFDANLKKEYGYDRYDNVITSIQFERILSSSGPTKGEILRPFDGQVPRKIAFIQCVGSRDLSLGNEFCSSVCCMHSIKQAIISKEHDSKILPTIFFIDIRSFGKDFERYYENAKKDYNVEFIRCLISKIYEQPKSKNLVVKYLNQINKIEEVEFDLVVLAVGLTNTCELKPLAEKLKVDLDRHGFAALKRYSPGLTSREGIYAAGTFLEPKDIPETVAEGSSAAALVSSLLRDSRGTLTKKREYPPERDISDEDIRIGVFVCRCGRNIASVVDVPEVVKYASKIEGVAYASEFLYSCSKDALDILKEKILEHNLNRVVVASCTPRTHEELFQDTVRETGLNRYLFEMTSLREQVSWVHKDYPKKATQKSKEMVEMIVAKVRNKKALGQELSEVVSKSLVVGGGASGLQAALSLAQQGYEVFLVEKEDSLGGHLKDLFDNLGREDPQVFLNSLVEKVQTHEKINIMLSSEIKSCSGYMGNYTSIIKNKDGEKEINHGVVILATGAKSYEPSPGEFGYQESEDIITQTRLEKMLFEGFGKDLAPKTFLMIQCVGSRDDEHPYCSRVCCAHAVKNAIKLKKLNPEHRVIVLYRDIRTYGFLEEYYLAAREAGVVFLRFDEISKPRVKINNNIITVTHTDSMLREDIVFEPDFLILSAGIVPEGSEEVSKIFKVPLNADNFFMEAHAKIRPLDFTTEGIFFCGLAHSPRFLSESLTQAQGASIRAVTVLSKDKIEAKAIIAEVNERLCKGCALCISACPFEARELDEETKIAKVIGVLCQGCGACAVACPSGATKHKGFSKKQIMDMVDKA